MKKHALKDLSETAHRFFPHYHCFESIDSTNTWLMEHKVPGSICLAKKQTAGRGTKGRKWYSDTPENLYFSFSFTHQNSDRKNKLPPFSLIAGLACCEALDAVGMKGQGIKWPNDIYCYEKKLAGILVEAAHNVNYWVIGIGMNVDSVPENLADNQATFLNNHIKSPVTPEQLASAILNSFTTLYADLNNALQGWDKWDILKGREVLLVTGRDQTKGRVHGLSSDGELIAEINGQLRTVSSGEVSVRNFYKDV